MFIHKYQHKIRVVEVISHQNKQVWKRSNYRQDIIAESEKNGLSLITGNVIRLSYELW